jgi:hypothetical protein
MSFDPQTLFFFGSGLLSSDMEGMNDIARKILLVTTFTPQYTRPI